jgi:hypothetical protein
MVTMSQKSSFLQPANSVSQVLIPDRRGILGLLQQKLPQADIRRFKPA